jgi:hypothetical protein
LLVVKYIYLGIFKFKGLGHEIDWNLADMNG